jgi:hypothetical protein
MRQQYIPAPPDIVVPELPRGAPRLRNLVPRIDIAPLDPLPAEPDVTMQQEPAPEPTVKVTPSAPEPPNPLREWCPAGGKRESAPVPKHRLPESTALISLGCVAKIQHHDGVTTRLTRPGDRCSPTISMI